MRWINNLRNRLGAMLLTQEFRTRQVNALIIAGAISNNFKIDEVQELTKFATFRNHNLKEEAANALCRFITKASNSIGIEHDGQNSDEIVQ